MPIAKEIGWSETVSERIICVKNCSLEIKTKKWKRLEIETNKKNNFFVEDQKNVVPQATRSTQISPK